jgi:hypothetical protein
VAALDYTSLVAMLAFVAAQVTGSDASEAEALLEASAADDCDADTPVKTYRPYWVIAHLLQARLTTAESLGSASGASIKYRDPLSAYRTVMARQAAFDKALCNIPEGFEAVLPGGVGSAGLTRVYA